MPHLWPNGLRSHFTVPCPQGGVSLLQQLWLVGWKLGIKETNGTNWDFRRLNGHSGGSARKNDLKHLKIWGKKWHKVDTQMLFVFGCSVPSCGICLDQLKTVLAEHRRGSCMHQLKHASALWHKVTELPLSQKFRFKAVLLSHWEASGMGWIYNSP